MCQLSTLLFKDFSLTILSRMGVFIMRNFIGNLFRFSTISLAIVGFFAPLSSAHASSTLVNGDFNGASGWTIVQDGGSGVSFQGSLRFSYQSGTVSQTVDASPGETLNLSFIVDNSLTNSVGQGVISDTWTATLSSDSASPASATVTRSIAHDPENFSLSIVIPQGATNATITFSGMDNGYWSGHYGPSIDNVNLSIIPAPTSLVVTSLEDTNTTGTLRWAINQANTISGGIYDSITFGINGTVSLTAALPQITQSVTITGNGITNTIIDGNNSYRIFDVRTAKTLTVSSMTLKRGQSTSGGLIYINNGTVNASNMRLTSMTGGSAVFTSNNYSYATYTDSTFDNLSVGIAGDWGNTPSLGDGVTSWDTFDDSGFTNRTYVLRGQFSNNTYAINNYRFTKIEDSTFTNNTYAAFITGWNRSQIYGSTFTNNTVAIYHSATITGGANMGTDNRIIVGNSFVNNTSAIILSDQYQVGGIMQKNQNSAKISNNNWDVNTLPGAKYITYYQFPDNTTPLYALPDSTGVPWSGTGNSVVTTTTTTTTTEPETTTTTEPEPETTTTTEPEPETTTTTEPEPETTTTTEPEIIPPVVIPPDTDPPVDDTEPEIIVPEPEVTEPEIIIPEPEVIEPEPEPETVIPEEISDQVDEILSGDLTEEEFANAVDEILTSADNEEELIAAATELLSGDLSEEQFTEVIDQVFTEELSDEAFAEVLDTVFEEPLSDEEFTAVIDAVLDQPLSDEQFENLVDVLSSDTVTDEQVQEAVDAIIENGITEDQATEISTSAEVLSSIDGEQAAEIFAEIPIDDITEEQALEIISAVQDAPTEVRSSFEEEINIFGSGSLNTYVPLGSSINVGQRRAVIAAGAVIAVAPVAGASRRR